MDDDEIRRHIDSITEPRARGKALRMLRANWPRAAADRSERVALEWLRRWRPERLGATLPACSCASGRCAVCN